MVDDGKSTTVSIIERGRDTVWLGFDRVLLIGVLILFDCIIIRPYLGYIKI